MNPKKEPLWSLHHKDPKTAMSNYIREGHWRTAPSHVVRLDTTPTPTGNEWNVLTKLIPKDFKYLTMNSEYASLHSQKRVCGCINSATISRNPKEW